MTNLKLRHIPRSRSMSILWLLEEIGCDYALEVINKGCSLDDALGFIARVPALRDGDAKMHESGAMTEWLCETRAPNLWRSPGSEGRFGWLDWLHFGDTLAQHATAVNRQIMQNATVPYRSDEIQQLEHSLDLLEDWLKDSEWLLSCFSGVDCQVGYSVWITSQITDFKHRPGLSAYLKRCCARDAFARAKFLSD